MHLNAVRVISFQVLDNKYLHPLWLTIIMATMLTLLPISEMLCPSHARSQRLSLTNFETPLAAERGAGHVGLNHGLQTVGALLTPIGDVKACHTPKPCKGRADPVSGWIPALLPGSIRCSKTPTLKLITPRSPPLQRTPMLPTRNDALRPYLLQQ